MICILTENKPWVPDAVDALESQGHEVEVTYTGHSGNRQTWYERLSSWLGTCADSPGAIEQCYGGDVVEEIGLISVRTDTETSDELNSIYDQILEIARE